MPDHALYDRDFALWTEAQAHELRRAASAGSNLPLDWENLAEEIESLGRSDKRELESLIELIGIHLLLLACSPAEQPRAGWMGEVDGFRARLARVLDNSPSLRARVDEVLGARWTFILKQAQRRSDNAGEGEAGRENLLAWKLSGPPAAEVFVKESFFPAPHGTTLEER